MKHLPTFEDYLTETQHSELNEIYLPNKIDAPKIIGNPITIKKIQVAEFDFPEKYTWSKAAQACAALGPGWRVPTLDEVNDLFSERELLGGLAVESYWTSTSYDSINAWYFYVSLGFETLQTHFFYKYYPNNVRAVKDK